MRVTARTVPLRFGAVAVVPWVFVLLWSTGFIGARLVVGEADPLAILTVRFALACLCALVIVAATRARFTIGWRLAGHVAVVGLLLHGVYLGGVFWSVADGLPAGVSALIVGLQPIVTACLVGALLGERVTRLQWLGFALGLVGIALVLWERLAIGGVGLGAVALSFVALAGITAGALYQKRYCTGVPIWPGAVIQYAAATVARRRRQPWRSRTPHRVDAEGDRRPDWMVLVLSIGAVSLLMLVIRRMLGRADRLAAVPDAAAGGARGLSRVRRGAACARAIVGLGVAALGVFLVRPWRPRREPRPVTPARWHDGRHGNARNRPRDHPRPARLGLRAVDDAGPRGRPRAPSSGWS